MFTRQQQIKAIAEARRDARVEAQRILRQIEKDGGTDELREIAAELELRAEILADAKDTIERLDQFAGLF